MNIERHIRTIPDWPRRGILFRDVTTLLRDADAFSEVIHSLATLYKEHGFDGVAGIEARGFVLGAPLAIALGVGFIPVRKEGKLPAAVFRREYQLEYGNAVLEIHQDAVRVGQRILVVDDLLATGGTAEAAVELLRQTGAVVEHAAFVIELSELGGAQRLGSISVLSRALVTYSGH